MRILAALIILGLLYWFLLRPVLLQWAALKPLYDRVDGLVLSDVQKLRLLFKGWKTILFSRFLMIAGGALPLLQQTETFDFSPYLPMLHLFGFEIPATIYCTMVGVPLIGWIVQKLRYVTDGAAGQNTLLAHLEPAPTVEQPAAVAPAVPLPVAPIETQVAAAIAQTAPAADAAKAMLLADAQRAVEAAGLTWPLAPAKV